MYANFGQSIIPSDPDIPTGFLETAEGSGDICSCQPDVHLWEGAPSRRERLPLGRAIGGAEPPVGPFPVPVIPTR